jgi:YVTN family beta-propeller protein
MNFLSVRSLSVLLVGLSSLLSSSAPAQTAFHVQARWSIGGKGGWDYLISDPTAHLLYVTHGERVEVVDINTGTVTGVIGELKGAHGVALDHAGKLGYISDGGTNSVVVFSRADFSKLDSIATGKDPDGIIYEPKTNSVVTLNGSSNDATVIDAATRKVVATIPMPGKPEFPSVDGAGNVFVNIEDKNEIVRLNLKTRKASAAWKLPGCESPTGMAIDVPGHRLFSVCDKKMIVLDSESGKHLGTVVTGDGADAAIYDETHHLAFSSNGLDGTLTIVDAGKPDYPLLQTVATQRSGRTMAFDSSTGRAFIAVAEQGPRPPATPDNPHRRPAILPGTFSILVIGRD